MAGPPYGVRVVEGLTGGFDVAVCVDGTYADREGAEQAAAYVQASRRSSLATWTGSTQRTSYGQWPFSSSVKVEANGGNVTEFSDRLNEARGAESIRSVAARAAMGGHVGESTIALYFRDSHRQPSLRVVVGLATTLGIPVDELRELAATDDGRRQSSGGGDTPMAALIDSASVLHGGASHQVLARIARQGGHEISSSTLWLLQSRPVTRRVGSIGGIKQGTIRAVAFLAQVPESVVREAAGVCEPEVAKQAAAARNRSMQHKFHTAGQAITLPVAFNQRSRWTRAEDERILAFMQAPNARINDLAKELGRSRAGITNRLQKLRRWQRESATAGVDCSAIQISSYEIAAEPGPTHCVGCGDELTDANAYSAGPHTDRWKRRCRPCTRAAARARYQSDPAVREKKRSSVRERYGPRAQGVTE